MDDGDALPASAAARPPPALAPAAKGFAATDSGVAGAGPRLEDGVASPIALGVRIDAAVAAAWPWRATFAAARAADCSRRTRSSIATPASSGAGGVHAPVKCVSVMNGCCSAWSGVHRAAGSHFKHPRSRSNNAKRSLLVASTLATPACFEEPLREDDDRPSSLFVMISLNAVCLKYFLPTAARFPESSSNSSSVFSLCCVTPVASPPIAADKPPSLWLCKSFLKNFFAFDADSSIASGGNPRVSTILVSRLYSEAPGNRGNPRNSSAMTHPKLHMSIGAPYSDPSTTSGEL